MLAIKIVWSVLMTALWGAFSYAIWADPTGTVLWQNIMLQGIVAFFWLGFCAIPILYLEG